MGATSVSAERHQPIILKLLNTLLSSASTRSVSILPASYEQCRWSVMRRRPPYRAARRPSCKYAVNIGSDSHLMNLAGDFAVLQWGNQHHANLSLLKTLN